MWLRVSGSNGDERRKLTVVGLCRRRADPRLAGLIGSSYPEVVRGRGPADWKAALRQMTAEEREGTGVTGTDWEEAFCRMLGVDPADP